MSRPLRLASTVVLLRQNKAVTSNYEAFLVKRAGTMSFMPNAYVFPGGALDESDQSPEWLSLLKHEPKLNSLKEIKSSQIEAGEGKLSQSLSLRIAAIREVFEETGVLIAKEKENGQVPRIEEDALRHWQKQIHDNSSTFLNFCNSFNVIPDIGRLMYWSNWITPLAEKKRFDTFFFLAVLDAQSLSKASHDNVEATNSKWLSPSAAVSAHDSEEIMLMPPTWYTMNELKKSSSIVDLTRESSQRNPQPILPLFTNDNEGNFMIAMPGDGFHPDSLGSQTKHRIYMNPRQSGGFNYKMFLPTTQSTAPPQSHPNPKL